jgi:hypothetical protein
MTRRILNETMPGAWSFLRCDPCGIVMPFCDAYPAQRPGANGWEPFGFKTAGERARGAVKGATIENGGSREGQPLTPALSLISRGVPRA